MNSNISYQYSCPSTQVLDLTHNARSRRFWTSIYVHHPSTGFTLICGWRVFRKLLVHSTAKTSWAAPFSLPKTQTNILSRMPHASSSSPCQIIYYVMTFGQPRATSWLATNHYTNVPVVSFYLIAGLSVANTILLSLIIRSYFRLP